MKTRQIQTIREQIVPAKTTEESTASLPAVIGGLPFSRGCAGRFASNRGPSEAKIARGIYGDLRIPQGELTTYSPTDHRRFEVEFQRDLTEMMMRLQRLKLHIAGDLNAGALSIQEAIALVRRKMILA